MHIPTRTSYTQVCTSAITADVRIHPVLIPVGVAEAEKQLVQKSRLSSPREVGQTGRCWTTRSWCRWHHHSTYCTVLTVLKVRVLHPTIACNAHTHDLIHARNERMWGVWKSCFSEIERCSLGVIRVCVLHCNNAVHVLCLYCCIGVPLLVTAVLEAVYQRVCFFSWEIPDIKQLFESAIITPNHQKNMHSCSMNASTNLSGEGKKISCCYFSSYLDPPCSPVDHAYQEREKK